MRYLILDTNILVRFLMQDHAPHNAAATSLFEKAENGEVTLYLDRIIIAETIYVLFGQHKRTRPVIATALLGIIGNAGIEVCEGTVMMDALERFAHTNVDFADCWLAAHAAHSGYGVASFDKDLDKFKDIKRITPK